MKLKLVADKLTVRGPKIDGSFVISLELGEYQQSTFADLIKELDMGNIVEVTLEQKSEKSD